MSTPRKLSLSEKVRMLSTFLRGCYGHFVLALLFACLAMLWGALTPQIVAITVDSLLGDAKPQVPDFLVRLLSFETLRQTPIRALLIATIAVVITAVGRSVCTFVQRTQLARGSEGFVKSMRDTLYAHILDLSFTWHKCHATGDVIQRCTSDVEVIREFVCAQLMEVFRTLFLVVLYVTILAQMNLQLTAVAVLCMFITGASSLIFYRRIADRFLEADEAEGDLTTCVQENLTGVRVVRAFGRERLEEEKFCAKNERFTELWIRLGEVLSVFWASGAFLTSAQILVTIVFGVVESIHGRLSLGTFLIFISYNESLAWPVRALGRVLSEMSKAGVSLDRVGYILQAPGEQHALEADALQKPYIGDICFSHVTFGYDDRPVLQDVSFTIHPGETFGILGGTGSGKSTLVHLLGRLYDLPDTGGSISIAGTDIRKLSLPALRRHIGINLQEPFLFSQTVGQNICNPCMPIHSDQIDTQLAQEMRRCAAIACVDDAISTFSDGYNTIVGERGVTLSGGQKQRVAIARLLMQNPPVMVFDDSLSAVDADTDAAIRHALHEQLQDTTVILISHRLTTLMQADRILVLDHGRVADIGTHEELKSRPGLYREIYEIQMRADDRLLLSP